MTLNSWVRARAPAFSRRMILGGIVVFGLVAGFFADWIYASSHLLLGGCLIVFALAAFGPLVVRATRGRVDPFEGRNIFILFFALYTLPYPLLTLLGQVPPLLPRFSESLVLQAMMLSLLGLIAFDAGYALVPGKRIADAVPLLPSVSPRRTLWAAAAVLLGSSILLGSFIVQVGGLEHYLGAGYLRLYELERGWEHLAVGLPLFGTGLLLLYHATDVTRSRVVGVLTWVLILATGAFLFAIGRRRYLLTLLLAIVVYRQYRRHRLSPAELLVLGAGGFLVFNVWGLLRRFPWHRFLSQEAWSEVFRRPLRDFIYTVAGEGEFSGAGVWLPQVLTHLRDGTMGYLFGSSYAQTPVAFIPRVLYPDRPMMLSEWYVTTYHPDLAAQGGGMGFFFLAEAYLNFGVVGIVAAMTLAGVLFRIVTEYLKKSSYSAPVVLLYAGIISWIPSGMRIDFATAVKGFVEFYFVVLLLAVLYSSAQLTRKPPPGKALETSGSWDRDTMGPRRG